ncbi:MAG: hypothetical protein ABR508_11835 [Candidatus Baltobacteraceae bacterium]
MRLAIAGVLALLAGAALFSLGHGTATAQRPCRALLVSRAGATYRVLFAKNGTVQQYLLVRGTGNTENDHDTLVALQAEYGPEAVNAPPLRVLRYREAGGGLRVPVKAIDSCGRISSFN